MRYCLALDLRDDPAVMAEYDRYHREVWPEVLEHLRASGIHDMTIWRRENRLVMLIDADPGFAPEQLVIGPGTHPRVKEWETLMA
jgi:L-rhamnose mutarotase